MYHVVTITLLSLPEFCFGPPPTVAGDQAMRFGQRRGSLRSLDPERDAPGGGDEHGSGADLGHVQAQEDSHHAGSRQQVLLYIFALMIYICMILCLTIILRCYLLIAMILRCFFCCCGIEWLLYLVAILDLTFLCVLAVHFSFVCFLMLFFVYVFVVFVYVSYVLCMYLQYHRRLMIAPQ